MVVRDRGKVEDRKGNSKTGIRESERESERDKDRIGRERERERKKRSRERESKKCQAFKPALVFQSHLEAISVLW